MTPRKAPNVSERLGRMLTVVPYLVQHPGTPLDEAASLFGVPASQLRRDLDLLFMSGLPPYSPGDLIDVEVDADGRVWIRTADHFSRPLRMTRREALAVYLRGKELLGTPGIPEAPALASALEKLEASLGAETLGDAEGIQLAEAAPPPALLGAVREGAREHRRASIVYRSGSTGEVTERTIEPEQVFASLGRWYVAAWDVAADAERLFRIDRMQRVDLASDGFEPRGLEGAGRALYSPTEEDVTARLLLAPAARWVAEYYATTDEREAPDGWLEVALPSRSLEWVAHLLLRLGADAQVLEPASLGGLVRDLARRTLAAYAS